MVEVGKIEETLAEFIGEVLAQKRVREADVTDGKALFGSSSHVKDLEKRIAELTPWRDRLRRGSEQRANYSRIIARLKSELSAAKKHAARAEL
jgi:hypothetical protein